MTIDPRRIEVMDKRVAEILNSMTPAERLEQGSIMSGALVGRLRRDIRSAHPQWGSIRVAEEIDRIMGHRDFPQVTASHCLEAEVLCARTD